MSTEFAKTLHWWLLAVAGLIGSGWIAGTFAGGLARASSVTELQQRVNDGEVRAAYDRARLEDDSRRIDWLVDVQKQLGARFGMFLPEPPPRRQQEGK